MAVEKVECTLRGQDQLGVATYVASNQDNDLVVQMSFTLSGCALAAPKTIFVVVEYEF